MSATDAVSPDTQANSTRSHTDLAFIVHSSDTLTNNLPPDVDNKSLARQKRRRTSPEDQLILEQEYKKNPKPDKAARMAIVRRVALGEKEVQIWFQNRRQASRRKSRPLEPHEYAQYQTLKQQHSNTGSSTPNPSQGAEPAFQVQLQEQEDAGEKKPRVPQPILTSIMTTLGLPPEEVPPSLGLAKSTASSYLADQRNEAFRSSQESPQSSATTVASSNTPSSSLPRKELRRVSSHVRLSMSADGNAEIVVKDGSSPSPPRRRLSPNINVAGDKRSGAIEKPKDSSPANRATPSLARKLSGRSRDSRAWTFFAEKNARSELQDMAAQEASGSAADAIGILRSTSGRSILGALSSKRSPAYGDFRQAKRAKKTPLLQRSQSMQNSRQSPQWKTLNGDKSPKKFKRAQSGLGIQVRSTDSDKENWSPERALGQDSPGSEGSEAGRGVSALHHRSTITPGKTLLGGLDAAAGSSGSDDSEDDEIAEFMNERRTRKSNSASEEEELDCVQGLLSLSQGAWK